MREVSQKSTINRQKELATGEEAVAVDDLGSSSGKPYLSIVTFSRNDDYSGNSLRRMQVSLDGRLEQLEGYRVESEIIIVDWNPPADKPLLKDVLKFPNETRCCTIRIIVVPSSIHYRYEYSDRTPMSGILAINCGIRRARGEFVLPATIDTLYSDDLMSFIAAKSLKRNERYRVDRCDVDRNVVQYNELDKQLDYCRRNIIKVNVQAPQPRRWLQRGLPNLHTNASGDFQLMSRHYWHLLHGYRESDIHGSYADGLLSYASYAAGVREVVLNDPLCIYHIDHDNKFNELIRRAELPFENWLTIPFLPTWINNKIIALYRRFLMLTGYEPRNVFRGIPTLGYATYRKMVREMVTGKRPYIFNDENWGLGQDTLEEFIISTAEWDKECEKN